MGNSCSENIVKDIPKTKNVIEKESAPLILLFRFIGTQYHGLQQNLDVHTVEKELIDAIIDAGLLPSDAHKNNINRYRWRTASRTDSGVHACANVISFKARNTAGICVGDIPKMINEKLPKTSTIEVVACLSFEKGFDAQQYAESRNYQYLLPVHILKDKSKKHLDYLRNEIMPLFVGHLNYHNFTRDVKATDKKAMRFIDTFTFSDPFKVDGTECVLFTIHGRAFMLNQIRMMVALVVAASHGQVGVEEVKRVFSEENWRIKMIVGDGLFLDKVEYTAFVKPTRKYPKSIETDVEFSEFRPEIERWKRENLFSHIVSLDKNTNSFGEWLENDLKKFKVQPRQQVEEEYQKSIHK